MLREGPVVVKATFLLPVAAVLPLRLSFAELPAPEAAALHSPSAAQSGSRRPLCRGWLMQELHPVVSLRLPRRAALGELLAVIWTVRAVGSSPQLSHRAVVSRTALGTL